MPDVLYFTVANYKNLEGRCIEITAHFEEVDQLEQTERGVGPRCVSLISACRMI
jgi:hypothetical protein